MVSFDITSDTHFDFFESYFDIENPADIRALWDSFEPKSRNLIIAGDIGHKNEQNYHILNTLKAHYYDTITFCLGNHDYYTCSEHRGNSQKRVQELKDFDWPEGINILDGYIIDIDGVKVGGSMGWYDGTYKTPNGIAPQLAWRRMNDSNFISIDKFNELFCDEYQKLELVVKKADIMVSHINPSNLEEHQNPIYRDDYLTMFYCFNGLDLLKKTKAKYWIYGHTHDDFEYEHEGVKVIAHPRGYPFQNSNYRLKTIEI